MVRQNRTVRLVAGLAFLVAAAVLFTGLVSLGPLTTLVAAVDLVVGLALVASGLRRGAGRPTEVA
ncbi:hypothetical protein [Salinigranum sp.]|jgi:hypothetical protein|uniref:hypothetical protein n=1 Tax=Salinigranum sp. TaxID=1966351 RepID=UPI003561C3C4